MSVCQACSLDSSTYIYIYIYTHAEAVYHDEAIKKDSLD